MRAAHLAGPVSAKRTPVSASVLAAPARSRPLPSDLDSGPVAHRRLQISRPDGLSSVSSAESPRSQVLPRTGLVSRLGCCHPLPLGATQVGCGARGIPVLSLLPGPYS